MPVEGFSNNKDFKVFYLAPINAESENQEISPSYYGQKIYQRLDNLRLFAYQKKYSSLIIVAPESSFPFLINKYLDQVDLWSNLLPKNAILMIGTLRSKNRNVYQTVAFIKRGLIIKYYDKHHLVLFTEELNHFLKNFPWTKKLFLNGKKQLNCAKKDMRNKTFSLNSKWCIIPQICSEFFWTFNFKDIEAFQREHRGRLGILFLFSNDSWFVPYFRENIENLIRLKSIYYNLPVLYIAHNSYFLISNFERN